VAVLVALAFWTHARTWLPLIGLIWAGATLAPVLPLLHHTYANYLYTPLAGLALALGGALVSLATPATPPQSATHSRNAAQRAGRMHTRTYLTAAAVAVALVSVAFTSQRLLEARVSRRYEGVDLPFDRQLRKSDMIRRATEGLRRTAMGTPKRIVIYSPSKGSNRLDQRTGTVVPDSTLTMDQMLMYQVLEGGRALRALTPGLDSVAFIERWTAEYADFDLCANTPAGDIVAFGAGADGLVRLGQQLVSQGNFPLARELLQPGYAAFPEDPRLRLLLEQTRAGGVRSTP
jgi:hypothetical protein